jgi:putative protease
MEIEVFAYGAICISYSGQCLMSASLKNRSANRGMCAQCCRLKYTDENGRPLPEGEYLLSPKDLNVIDRLPELMEAGVASLKIEGRMKRPEYVYLAVRTFREAIDAFAEGKEYRVSKQRQKDLLLMFNRGFSHGHLFHENVSERMSWYRPNHMGVNIGKVIRYEKGRVLVKLSDTLNQNDGLRILDEKTDIGLTAVKIEKNGKLVSKADSGDAVWLQCRSDTAPKAGANLQKTSDRVLIEKIDDQIAAGKNIPVSLKYRAKIGQPFEVILSDNDGHEVNAVSEFIVEKAKNAPLAASKIETAMGSEGRRVGKEV